MLLRILFISLNLIMVCLSSCATNIPTRENKENVYQDVETNTTENITVPLNIAEYEDARADIKSSILPSADSKIIDMGMKNLCWIPPVTVEESCEYAQNIVVGKVLDITYCDEGGEAMTFYSFAVEDVWKGTEIAKESIITVLEFQGYRRLSEVAKLYEKQGYKNWYSEYSDAEKEIIFEKVTYVNEPMIQVDDEYILFLGKSEDWDVAYIEGSFFTLPAMYAGKYTLNEDGLYTQYISEDDKVHYGKTDSESGVFTLNESWKNYEEMKNIVKSN